MRSRYYAINIDIPSNIPFEEHAVKSRLGDIDQAPPLYPLAPEMRDDGSLLQIGAIPSFQRPFKVKCQWTVRMDFAYWLQTIWRND